MTAGKELLCEDMAMENIITFKDGLLGIEHLKKYILLSPEGNLPFQYLQSIEDKNLAFVVIDPYLYLPDYSFNLFDDVIDELKIEKASDVLVLNVVVMPEDIKKMTANFAAPIIIHVNTRVGKQIVLSDSKYEIRQPIFDLFKAIHSQEAEKC